MSKDNQAKQIAKGIVCEHGYSGVSEFMDEKDEITISSYAFNCVYSFLLNQKVVASEKQLEDVLFDCKLLDIKVVFQDKKPNKLHDEYIVNFAVRVKARKE